MAHKKNQETQQLNAFLLPNGFVIDDLPDQPIDSLKTWSEAFDTDIQIGLICVSM